MSGAEVFLAGPLVALANILMKWALKKFHAAKEAKEDRYETQRLVEAVRKLAAFANAKADTIAQLHLDLNLRAESLNMLLAAIIGAQDEVRGILDDKLPAKKTRTRIEGVQSRLTNLLVFHFGTVMVEGLASNAHMSRQIAQNTGMPPFYSSSSGPGQFDDHGFQLDSQGWQIPPSTPEHQGFVAQQCRQGPPPIQTTYPAQITWKPPLPPMSPNTPNRKLQKQMRSKNPYPGSPTYPPNPPIGERPGECVRATITAGGDSYDIYRLNYRGERTGY